MINKPRFPLLLLLTLALQPSTAAPAKPQSQALLQLETQVHFDGGAMKCRFELVMGSRRGDYSVDCDAGGRRGEGRFNVTEIIEQEMWDQHVFGLVGQEGEDGRVVCTTGYGVEWTYNLTVKVKQNQLGNISGMLITHKYSIVYLSLMYCILALVALPPLQPYYLYMQGLPIFSSLISILLTTAMTVNLSLIAYRYLSRIVSTDLAAEPVIMLLVLVACFGVSFAQLCYKLRTYCVAVRMRYYSGRVVWAVLGVSGVLLLLAFVAYVNIHKDVSTYIGFAVGLIYYMVGFIICRPKKGTQVFFSLRLILLDGLSIMSLALSSKVYPILHYQIPNLYSLIAVLLLISVLFIYAGITYILISIIGRDSYRHEESQLVQIRGVDTTQMQKTTHQNMVLERYNEEKEKVDGEGGGREGREGKESWKQVKQESMVSELENNSDVIDKQEIEIRNI